jgi:uncharacterized protein
MSDTSEKKIRRMRPCPICSKLSTDADYPFCSPRCANVDLHRWFSEGYTIPVVETDDIDDPDRDNFDG